MQELGSQNLANFVSLVCCPLTFIPNGSREFTNSSSINIEFGIS